MRSSILLVAFAFGALFSTASADNQTVTLTLKEEEILLNGESVAKDDLAKRLELQMKADDAILMKREKTASVKELADFYKTLEGLGYRNLQATTLGGRFEETVTTGEIPQTDDPEVLIVRIDENDEIFMNDKKITRKGLGIQIEATKEAQGAVSVLIDGSSSAVNGLLDVLGVCDMCGVKDVAILRSTEDF